VTVPVVLIRTIPIGPASTRLRARHFGKMIPSQSHPFQFIPTLGEIQGVFAERIRVVCSDRIHRCRALECGGAAIPLYGRAEGRGGEHMLPFGVHPEPCGPAPRAPRAPKAVSRRHHTPKRVRACLPTRGSRRPPAQIFGTTLGRTRRRTQGSPKIMSLRMERSS
jgi:hypothetical protein